MPQRKHAAWTTLALVAGLFAVVSTADAVPSRSAGTAHAERSRPCARVIEQETDSSAKYEITSGGIERSYILRLPEGYDRRQDWPLIVAYHGRGSTGVEVEGYSGLSDLPAVVAYPDGAVGTGSGYRKAWQGAPYEPVGVDDVAFTEDLLDHLQATLCVDADRTYATGKSNGAGLVSMLACRLPDRFAAVAPVAGAYYPETRTGCDQAPAVPAIIVHGTGDATIPYAGDADRDLPAVPDWAQAWAGRNGCQGRPRTLSLGRDVTATQWRHCRDGADVEHVAVLGGGHVWPGADTYSGGGHVSHTIDAERVIWRFLRRHAR